MPANFKIQQVFNSWFFPTLSLPLLVSSFLFFPSMVIVMVMGAGIRFHVHMYVDVDVYIM